MNAVVRGIAQCRELGSAVTVFPTLSVCRCLNIRCSPDCLEDESDIIALQSYFPINFENRTPLVVASPERIGGSPTPAAESEESEPALFHRDDFVLLTDDIKHWIVRIGDISLLEACRNLTLVHFPDGKVLIRRSLARIFHTPCDEIGGSAVEIVIELALMP
jgi:hypothetical protein